MSANLQSAFAQPHTQTRFLPLKTPANRSSQSIALLTSTSTLSPEAMCLTATAGVDVLANGAPSLPHTCTSNVAFSPTRAASTPLPRTNVSSALSTTGAGSARAPLAADDAATAVAALAADALRDDVERRDERRDDDERRDERAARCVDAERCAARWRDKNARPSQKRATVSRMASNTGGHTE